VEGYFFQTVLQIQSNENLTNSIITDDEMSEWKSNGSPRSTKSMWTLDSFLWLHLFLIVSMNQIF